MFKIQVRFKRIWSFKFHKTHRTLKFRCRSTFESVVSYSCVFSLVTFPTFGAQKIAIRWQNPVDIFFRRVFRWNAQKPKVEKDEYTYVRAMLNLNQMNKTNASKIRNFDNLQQCNGFICKFLMDD